ncbi:MAG: NAD(P)/FAD-dependent oxidoreductase [Candidatus Helarchaeota archaeon]|nr:NAD(P)/FAD-dependent oxidoreductase [Candidatus Helarchaeota archaeon]
MDSIIIVGAGPAGSTCAETLAKNGFQVTIIEKEKLPRYKACGGAIPKEMLDKFKIPSEIIQRYFNSLTLHHIANNIVIDRKGEGAILWRSDLDAFLTQRASNSGARLEENTSVTNIIRKKTGFEIKTTKGDFKSDWIIAADGVNSTVLRLCGWRKFLRNELALTITHEIALSKQIIEKRLGSDQLHIYFGKQYFGTGYGWLFPKKDVISVGWGCRLPDIRNSNQQFQEFTEMVHDQIKGGKLIKKAAHLVPVGVRSIYRDRIIAIGDAAGFVDPLSGKGIPYACLSGIIAGQVLKKAIDKNKLDEFKELYEKKLTQAFLTALIAKRDIQPEVYGSDENILRFMKLWQNHRSTEIAMSLWKNK